MGWEAGSVGMPPIDSQSALWGEEQGCGLTNSIIPPTCSRINRFRLPATPRSYLIGAKMPGTPGGVGCGNERTSPDNEAASAWGGITAGSATPAPNTPALCNPRTVAVPPASTFKCTQCQLDKSTTELVMKGTQAWCEADSRSYEGLARRWKNNAALRKWWQAFTPQAKIAWFLNWQGLEPRAKFDFIQFVERTLKTQELIEDEITAWIPYAEYYKDKVAEGKAPRTIEAMWAAEIEARRAECQWHRSQWLLPVFKGLERRVRSRSSQECEAMKSVNVGGR